MEWIKLFDKEKYEQLVDNKPQLAIVHGVRICLVKREGKLLATSDRCTHNGESLSKGAINYKGEVVCPWHGYIFDLKTGRESQQRSDDLDTYTIREAEDGMYIGL